MPPVTSPSPYSAFATKSEYWAFITRWKALARAKLLTREDCLLRCLLLDRDVARSFPTTQSVRRWENGGEAGCGRHQALLALRTVDPSLSSAAQRERLNVYFKAKGLDPQPVFTYWAERWTRVNEPDSQAQGLRLSHLQTAQARARALPNA